MATKIKIEEKLRELKDQVKKKQAELTAEWQDTKRELKARQRLLKGEFKSKQEEFLLEWDDVEEKTRQAFDSWLEKFDVKELQAMLDRYKEENEPLEPLPPDAVIRKLPTPAPMKMPLDEALMKRRSLRDYSGEPIAEEHLAALLWAADGINRKNLKRTTPSTMNWQEIAIYVVQANGIWKYLPKRHALLFIEGKDQREHFGEIKTWMKLASQHLVFVSDTRKTDTLATKLLHKSFKVDLSEGELAIRSQAIDVGAKVQAVYMAAAALGLGCTCRLIVNEDKPRELMKLAPEEKIMAVCSVGERPASLFDHVI